MKLSFLKYLRGIYNLNLTSSNTVHNAIIQSIYDCFIMVDGDIDEMRLEMCLLTATGRWLDYWGEYFSVYRKSGEEDSNYAKRIISNVIQPKSTIPAIKNVIIDYLNSKYNTEYTHEDIKIAEPWQHIGKYSHKGGLSEDARFYSSDYYSHAVLDISIPEDITKELLDIVKSVKAAGIKVMWSVLNSYEIVSEFNDADDAYASYHRRTQLKTNRLQSFGFMLSTSSSRLSGGVDGVTQRKYSLSGIREIWRLTESQYQWYAKVNNKNTDESIIITKKDLIGLLDYYTKIEKVISKIETENHVLLNGYEHTVLDKDNNENNVKVDHAVESMKLSSNAALSSYRKLSGKTQTYTIEKTLIKITDELLESFELLDTFLSLSKQGRLSTSNGVLFKHIAEFETYNKLIEEIERFKETNRDYYDSVQPPILNGERVKWYVTRDKNWIWNTPTLTLQDFYDLWEPFGEAEEHTINSIIDFEDAYYKGYITFGDKYQPPIVVGDKKYPTTHTYGNYLFNSPLFTIDDLDEIYRRQFNHVTYESDKENVTTEDIILLESSNLEQYSTSAIAQPEIEIKTEAII